jgi:hypothetical protein
MGGPRWAYCVWPGLPQLWLQGSWPSLGVAVSFALVLNLAVASSLVWVDLLPPMVRTATWLLVGVMWLASAISSYRWLGTIGRDHPDATADAAYASGVEHYLQGNWFEAEVAFSRLVQRNSRDVESRLMLASLCRHAGRPDEARVYLTDLQKLSGAEKWGPEIHRELGLLADGGRELDRDGEAAPTDERPTVKDPADEWSDAA